jgi:hypothetical protein
VQLVGDGGKRGTEILPETNFRVATAVSSAMRARPGSCRSQIVENEGVPIWLACHRTFRNRGYACSRMALDTRKIWRRRHANGVTAEVATISPGADVYGYSATGRGPIGYMGHKRGLDEAKAAADHAAGCKQPCTCPPWDE